jgi:hemerythrin-like domain-containing protein
MPDPVSEWREEHARFSRLLDVLEGEVAKFHREEHPDYDLMREIVGYLRDCSGQVHHPREDAALARLVARDPGMRLPANRLLQEHRVIATAEEELLRRLDDIEADAVVQRSVLEAAAATYLVYYRHHIATEEAEILPRAAMLLTEQDWEAVAAAVPARPDPLANGDFETRYRVLRGQLGSAARE